MFKSIWKGYSNKCYSLPVCLRAEVITKPYNGKMCLVYSGKEYISLFIRDEMVGYRFGDFILTRKIGDLHFSRVGGKIRVIKTKKKIKGIMRVKFSH